MMPTFNILDDPHTCANYKRFLIKHLDWSIHSIDFNAKLIHATAKYTVKVIECEQALYLDCSHIKVHECHVNGRATLFELGKGKFGGTLKINLLPSFIEMSTNDFELSIKYETTSECTAVQWLKDKQGMPFLFTQCQAIHARSLLPVQDTPSVKFTYTASVTKPDNLKVLMSALEQESTDQSVCVFKQPVAIPAYLLALAIGDLRSRDISPRCRVWAEPHLIERAAEEFAETELFLKTAESIAGPYVWGRYDLLVLPGSFPYGGMENPCLTFLSPSLVVGDKSLVDVVAHEIAHSWSGNLVTNANWAAFWLNEGTTMFLERKITGLIRGESYRQFDACLGLTELRKDVEQFGCKHPATALTPDLTNLDPDDAYSRVPYEKGHTFLYFLEGIVNQSSGENLFNRWLKSYFAKFAGQSVTVKDWLDYFLAFFKSYPDAYAALQKVDFEKWMYNPGMPDPVPSYDESMCACCRLLADQYIPFLSF